MRWTCFSGCGSGNVFQLVQKIEGCSFPEALDKVKQEMTGEWEQTKRQVEQVFHPVSEPKSYKTIPLSSWEKMERALENSPMVVDWLLRERGIEFETAKRLRVGFAPSIGNLAGQDGADISDKGWIAFPSIEGDQVVSIKYRSITRKKPGGFARQSGMATALWNTESIDVFEPVYLTEGEFDAMVLEQAGFRAVSVPSAGVKPSATHKDQLMRASCVILAGDNDGGVGSNYMEGLWRSLSERAFLLKWDDGYKDANEVFLKQCGGNVETFKKKVEELTHKAKSQPMPSVYSVQEVLMGGQGGTLSERPDRLRFSWPTVDKMLVILPGHVFGMGSSNSGMGKTMWTVQTSLHNARKYGRCVLNFQAEMSPAEIADLIACQMLRVDRNFLTDEDRARAAEQLEGVQYFVGSDPNLTELKEVLDLLEAAIKRLSPEIVLLDHFHFFSVGSYNETKAQSEAMARIKRMAEMYQVIFINVGQPRKATQSNKGKRIHITDFKGSGAWGDNANSIIVIHRELNKSDEPGASKGPYEDKCLVQVVKGRSLGTGVSACSLTCFGEFGSFEEIESNYEEPE